MIHLESRIPKFYSNCQIWNPDEKVPSQPNYGGKIWYHDISAMSKDTPNDKEQYAFAANNPNMQKTNTLTANHMSTLAKRLSEHNAEHELMQTYDIT